MVISDWISFWLSHCWLIEANNPVDVQGYFLFLKYYLLFLAALGLCFHERAFFSCREGRLLSGCSGFFCCRAQALGWAVSVVVTHGLSCSMHVESSQTRDQTCVPCITTWILNHWTTRPCGGHFLMHGCLALGLCGLPRRYMIEIVVLNLLSISLYWSCARCLDMT